MSAITFDLVILAILALFIWRGWAKGLLLSLCGLAVMIASFLGAGFLADTLDTPVADALQPKLTAAIRESIQTHMDTLGEGGQTLDPLSALRDMGGLYQWAADAVEEAQGTAGAALSSTIEGIARTAARTVAVQLAHHVVFVLSFLVLFILLHLLLHAMDLVAKLPGLHFCNGLGGGIIGGVKGILMVFLALSVIWMSRPNPFPAETVEQSLLLKYLIQFNPLLTLFATP